MVNNDSPSKIYSMILKYDSYEFSTINEAKGKNLEYENHDDNFLDSNDE